MRSRRITFTGASPVGATDGEITEYHEQHGDAQTGRDTDRLHPTQAPDAPADMDDFQRAIRNTETGGRGIASSFSMIGAMTGASQLGDSDQCSETYAPGVTHAPAAVPSPTGRGYHFAFSAEISMLTILLGGFPGDEQIPGIPAGILSSRAFSHLLFGGTPLKTAFTYSTHPSDAKNLSRTLLTQLLGQDPADIEVEKDEFSQAGSTIRENSLHRLARFSWRSGSRDVLDAQARQRALEPPATTQPEQADTTQSAGAAESKGGSASPDSDAGTASDYQAKDALRRKADAFVELDPAELLEQLKQTPPSDFTLADTPFRLESHQLEMPSLLLFLNLEPAQEYLHFLDAKFIEIQKICRILEVAGTEDDLPEAFRQDLADALAPLLEHFATDSLNQTQRKKLLSNPTHENLQTVAEIISDCLRSEREDFCHFLEKLPETTPNDLTGVIARFLQQSHVVNHLNTFIHFCARGNACETIKQELEEIMRDLETFLSGTHELSALETFIHNTKLRLGECRKYPMARLTEDAQTNLNIVMSIFEKFVDHVEQAPKAIVAFSQRNNATIEKMTAVRELFPCDAEDLPPTHARAMLSNIVAPMYQMEKALTKDIDYRVGLHILLTALQESALPQQSNSERNKTKLQHAQRIISHYLPNATQETADQVIEDLKAFVPTEWLMQAATFMKTYCHSGPSNGSDENAAISERKKASTNAMMDFVGKLYVAAAPRAHSREDVIEAALNINALALLIDDGDAQAELRHQLFRRYLEKLTQSSKSLMRDFGTEVRQLIAFLSGIPLNTPQAQDSSNSTILVSDQLRTQILSFKDLIPEGDAFEGLRRLMSEAVITVSSKTKEPDEHSQAFFQEALIKLINVIRELKSSTQIDQDEHRDFWDAAHKLHVAVQELLYSVHPGAGSDTFITYRFNATTLQAADNLFRAIVERHTKSATLIKPRAGETSAEQAFRETYLHDNYDTTETKEGYVCLSREARARRQGETSFSSLQRLLIQAFGVYANNSSTNIKTAALELIRLTSTELASIDMHAPHLPGIELCFCTEAPTLAVENLISTLHSITERRYAVVSDGNIASVSAAWLFLTHYMTQSLLARTMQAQPPSLSPEEGGAIGAVLHALSMGLFQHIGIDPHDKTTNPTIFLDNIFRICAVANEPRSPNAQTNTAKLAADAVERFCTLTYSPFVKTSHAISLLLTGALTAVSEQVVNALGRGVMSLEQREAGPAVIYAALSFAHQTSINIPQLATAIRLFAKAYSPHDNFTLSFLEVALRLRSSELLHLLAEIFQHAANPDHSVVLQAHDLHAGLRIGANLGPSGQEQPLSQMLFSNSIIIPAGARPTSSAQTSADTEATCFAEIATTLSRLATLDLTTTTAETQALVATLKQQLTNAKLLDLVSVVEHYFAPPNINPEDMERHYRQAARGAGKFNDSVTSADADSIQGVWELLRAEIIKCLCDENTPDPVRLALTRVLSEETYDPALGKSILTQYPPGKVSGVLLTLKAGTVKVIATDPTDPSQTREHLTSLDKKQLVYLMLAKFFGPNEELLTKLSELDPNPEKRTRFIKDMEQLFLKRTILFSQINLTKARLALIRYWEDLQEGEDATSGFVTAAGPYLEGFAAGIRSKKLLAPQTFQVESHGVARNMLILSAPTAPSTAQTNVVETQARQTHERLEKSSRRLLDSWTLKADAWERYRAQERDGLRVETSLTTEAYLIKLYTLYPEGMAAQYLKEFTARKILRIVGADGDNSAMVRQIADNLTLDMLDFIHDIMSCMPNQNDIRDLLRIIFIEQNGRVIKLGDNVFSVELDFEDPQRNDLYKRFARQLADTTRKKRGSCPFGYMQIVVNRTGVSQAALDIRYNLFVSLCHRTESNTTLSKQFHVLVQDREVRSRALISDSATASIQDAIAETRTTKNEHGLLNATHLLIGSDCQAFPMLRAWAEREGNMPGVSDCLTNFHQLWDQHIGLKPTRAQRDRGVQPSTILQSFEEALRCAFEPNMHVKESPAFLQMQELVRRAAGESPAEHFRDLAVHQMHGALKTLGNKESDRNSKVQAAKLIVCIVNVVKEVVEAKHQTKEFEALRLCAELDTRYQRHPTARDSVQLATADIVGNGSDTSQSTRFLDFARQWDTSLPSVDADIPRALMQMLTTTHRLTGLELNIAALGKCYARGYYSWFQKIDLNLRRTLAIDCTGLPNDLIHLQLSQLATTFAVERTPLKNIRLYCYLFLVAQLLGRDDLIANIKSQAKTLDLPLSSRKSTAYMALLLLAPGSATTAQLTRFLDNPMYAQTHCLANMEEQASRSHGIAPEQRDCHIENQRVLLQYHQALAERDGIDSGQAAILADNNNQINFQKHYKKYIKRHPHRKSVELAFADMLREQYECERGHLSSDTLQLLGRVSLDPVGISELIRMEDNKVEQLRIAISFCLHSGDAGISSLFGMFLQHRFGTQPNAPLLTLLADLIFAIRPDPEVELEIFRHKLRGLKGPRKEALQRLLNKKLGVIKSQERQAGSLLLEFASSPPGSPDQLLSAMKLFKYIDEPPIYQLRDVALTQHQQAASAAPTSDSDLSDSDDSGDDFPLMPAQRQQQKLFHGLSPIRHNASPHREGGARIVDEAGYTQDDEGSDTSFMLPETFVPNSLCVFFREAGFTLLNQQIADAFIHYFPLINHTENMANAQECYQKLMASDGADRATDSIVAEVGNRILAALKAGKVVVDREEQVQNKRKQIAISTLAQLDDMQMQALLPQSSMSRPALKLTGAPSSPAVDDPWAAAEEVASSGRPVPAPLPAAWPQPGEQQAADPWAQQAASMPPPPPSHASRAAPVSDDPLATVATERDEKAEVSEDPWAAATESLMTAPHATQFKQERGAPHGQPAAHSQKPAASAPAATDDPWAAAEGGDAAATTSASDPWAQANGHAVAGAGEAATGEATAAHQQGGSPWHQMP